MTDGCLSPEVKVKTAHTANQQHGLVLLAVSCFRLGEHSVLGINSQSLFIEPRGSLKTQIYTDFKF
jgi:hypothetical protein